MARLRVTPRTRSTVGTQSPGHTDRRAPELVKVVSRRLSMHEVPCQVFRVLPGQRETSPGQWESCTIKYGWSVAGIASRAVNQQKRQKCSHHNRRPRRCVKVPGQCQATRNGNKSEENS